MPEQIVTQTRPATRTTVAPRPMLCGMRLNHNQTVLRGMKLNHNQTVLRGIKLNHNQTVLTGPR